MFKSQSFEYMIKLVIENFYFRMISLREKYVFTQILHFTGFSSDVSSDNCIDSVLTPAGDLINLTIGDTQNPRVGQLKRITHMSG